MRVGIRVALDPLESFQIGSSLGDRSTRATRVGQGADAAQGERDIHDVSRRNHRCRRTDDRLECRVGLDIVALEQRDRTEVVDRRQTPPVHPLPARAAEVPRLLQPSPSLVHILDGHVDVSDVVEVLGVEADVIDDTPVQRRDHRQVIHRARVLIENRSVQEPSLRARDRRHAGMAELERDPQRPRERALGLDRFEHHLEVALA